jgi:hypothetical protein
MRDVDIMDMHALVMCRGVMLGEVVCQIIASWFIINPALTLCNPIFESIKPHVQSFGSLLIHFVVQNFICSWIVCMYGGFWLRVPHIQRGVDAFALVKTEPTSTYAAAEITCFMMLERQRGGKLMSCGCPPCCPI